MRAAPTIPLALLAAALLAPACAGPKGRYVTADELPGLTAAGAPGTTRDAPAAREALPATKPSDALQERRDALDTRTLALERRREDHAAGLAELARKRSRATLEHDASRSVEEHALRRAEWDLANARRDLEHFTAVEHDRRLEQDALELRAVADALLEAREELAQLEMMYEGASLGDATAEIVLKRGLRRLQRSEQGHRLRELRSAELREITLPRERQRLELELTSKELAVEAARVAEEKARSLRQTALAELEAAALKLVRELEDIEREARDLKQDLASWDRDYAAEAAATPVP